MKNEHWKEINILKEIIKKSKNKEIKALTKIKLKTDELDLFDDYILEKLSKTKTNILHKEFFGYKIPPNKIGNEGTIIEYSKDRKEILFYLGIIKKHLKKIEE